MADVPKDSTGAAPKRPALRPFSGHSRDAGQGSSRPVAAGRPVVAPFAVRPHQGVRPTPTVATPTHAVGPLVAQVMIERTPMQEYSSDPAAALTSSETLSATVAAVPTDQESATAGLSGSPELGRESPADGGSSDSVTDDTAGAAPSHTAQSTLQPSGETVAFLAALDTSSLEKWSRNSSSLDSVVPEAGEDDASISDIDDITYGSSAAHEARDTTSAEGLEVVSREEPNCDSGLLELVSEVAVHAVADDALVISVDAVSIPAAADVQGEALAPPEAVEQYDLLDDALADFELDAGELVEVPRPIPGPDLTLRDYVAAQGAQGAHALPLMLSADESVNDEGNSGSIALTVDQTANLSATHAGTVAPTLAATLAGAHEIAFAPSVDGGSSVSDVLPLNAEMPAVDEELRAFVARAHVVEMLQVVARRVQAGEIVVVVDANATPEAVLARVLASLLSP
ncbi:MAG: hypothetical protein Q8K82_20060 [Gemmatimonadaceae bacterium]|nr:hypothetical protein [Gemmatimonadaceae bacterium]